jgi:hypothetical protein
MTTPIATVGDIPVFAALADLDTTQQEHGNLSVTVTPATLWIWLDGAGWTPVAAPAGTAELAERVTRLEGRLACIATCLMPDEGEDDD